MQNNGSGQLPWPAGHLAAGAQTDQTGLYHQFQLQRTHAEMPVPPASGIATGSGLPFPSPGLINPLQLLASSTNFPNPLPPRFSSGGLPSLPSSLQQPQQPANPQTNNMQMLLANAMSVPLATMLFQSMMGGSQPGLQPAQPPGLMQMMQQAYQAGASSAVPPQLSPVGVPPVPASMPPPPVLQPAPPAVASTSNAAPASHVHLPQLEPSVAKDMLFQLVNQLQNAGQLPNDDSIRRLLQPDEHGNVVPKVEVKTEVMDVKPKDWPDEPVLAPEERMPPQVYVDVALDSHTVYPVASQSERESMSESDQRTTRNAGRGRSSVAKKRSQARGKRLTVQSRQSSRSSERSASASRSSPSFSRSSRLSPSTSHGHVSPAVSRGRSSPRSVSSDGKLSEKYHERSTSRSKEKTVLRGESSERSSASDRRMPECFVKLDRVASGTSTESLKKDTEETDTATIPSSPPLSRLAKLRNYCVPKDILTSKPVPSAAAGSAQQLAQQQQKSDMNTAAAVQPEHRPNYATTDKTATKNIFSIFAQPVRNPMSPPLEDPEPPTEPRPSNPLPASLAVLLQRSVNSSRKQSLRSMYMGFDRQHMEWLSLVSCMFTGSSKSFCQCSFCPAVGELPRDVAQHIGREHQDCMFALNKLTPAVGPLMYINCRHCNFVTVEETLLWIHFDAHHAVPGILDWTDTPPEQHISGPDTPAKFIDVDEVMGTVTAFVCFDCSAVNADPDATASSMLMARHVINAHPDSPNYNGCFVKLMMLTRNDSDPNSIKGVTTYRQAICDRVHARGRREIFICMFCKFSSFSTYLALSHSLLVHQNRNLLYACSQSDCQYQCLRAIDMTQHIRVEHSTNENVTPLVSSASLVERKISGDGYVECPVLVGRNSGLTYVNPQPPQGKKQKRKTTSGKKPATKRTRAQVSSEDESSEDFEEGDSDDDETYRGPRRTTRGMTVAKSKTGAKGRKVDEPAEKQAEGHEPDEQSAASPSKTSDEPMELQSTAVSSSNEHSSGCATGAIDAEPSGAVDAEPTTDPVNTEDTEDNAVVGENTAELNNQEVAEPTADMESSETSSVAVNEVISDATPAAETVLDNFPCTSTMDDKEQCDDTELEGAEDESTRVALDSVPTSEGEDGNGTVESVPTSQAEVTLNSVPPAEVETDDMLSDENPLVNVVISNVRVQESASSTASE